MDNDGLFTKTFNLSQIIIPTLMINALSFAIALSWNSTIQSLLEYYFPIDNEHTNNVWIKFFTTLFVTFIIIFVVVFLTSKLNIDVNEFINKKG